MNKLMMFVQEWIVLVENLLISMLIITVFICDKLYHAQLFKTTLNLL